MLTKPLIGLILLAGLALAQEEALGPNGQPKPEPYSFSYSADASGALSSHQETGDGTGRITGVYTIAGPDGRERRVEYVADADGYRATIKTNEIGTKPGDGGDTRWQVSEPSPDQLSAANNANRLNPNANGNRFIAPQQPQLIAPLPAQFGQSAQGGQFVSRPIQAQQPQQVPELSSGSAAGAVVAGQQQEQIPSANNPRPSASLAPPNSAQADESQLQQQQQQQTLINLDDISDQPPQEVPQLQQVQFEAPQQQRAPLQPNFRPIAPPQQQFIQAPLPQPQFFVEQPRQQQILVQAPQQPQPLPAPTFQARQPQGQVLQFVQEQQQQQQQQEQRNENNEAEIRPTTPLPERQAIKTQEIVETPAPAPAPAPVPSPIIGPGSAGQRGPELIQINNLAESRFGPRPPPQQQQQQQFIEQLQRIEEQRQYQLPRLEPAPQPQFIQLPEPQFRPQAPPQQQRQQQQQQQFVQVIEQQQPQPSPQPAPQQVKGGAVKTIEVSRLPQEPAPQPQFIQRVEPAPQPQFIQRIEPAPQPQFIQRIEPQPQFIEQPPQPQLIPVPLEPEIQIPNFAIERITPLRQPQPQPQPAPAQFAVKAPQPAPLPQINLLPTQGLKFEPIFKQIAVKGNVIVEQPTSTAAPIAEQPRQLQQTKGQLEVISLREEPAPAPAPVPAPAPAPEAAAEQDSGNNSNSEQDSQANDAETEAPSTPATTTTTTVLPPIRPNGRVVFGKTRFGAPNGVKFGTKTAAQPQLVRQVIAVPPPPPPPQPQPQPQPQAIKTIQVPVPAPAPIQLTPEPLPQPQQFIAFGTRLNTKTSSS